jgi:hypothetical protein
VAVPSEVGRRPSLAAYGLVVGGTAALIATDPETMPHFRQTTAFHGFNRVFTSTVSGGIIAAVPATFYAASLIRKNSYDQGTALLAGEAVVDDTGADGRSQIHYAATAAHGCRGKRKLFRHLFPKQQMPDRQGHQLSVGARADELFRGHGVCTGSLPRIRSSERA